MSNDLNDVPYVAMTNMEMAKDWIRLVGENEKLSSKLSIAINALQEIWVDNYNYPDSMCASKLAEKALKEIKCQ